ncbi:MAG: hypothetical protein IPI21_11180 [Propionivibrio sp.]|nr:hypothetical protein [Propionivibrio sp.]
MPREAHEFDYTYGNMYCKRIDRQGMNRQNDAKRVDSESGIRRDASSPKGSKPKSPKRAAQRGQRPIGNVAVWYNPPPYHGNDILDGGGGKNLLVGGEGQGQGAKGDENGLSRPFGEMLRSAGKNGQKQNITDFLGIPSINLPITPAGPLRPDRIQYLSITCRKAFSKFRRNEHGFCE